MEHMPPPNSPAIRRRPKQDKSPRRQADKDQEMAILLRGSADTPDQQQEEVRDQNG